jgi:uncharacterized damage-inducible protein DinB
MEYTHPQETPMRSTKLIAATVLATVFAAPALAAQAPKTGWRAEFLTSFGGAEKKFLALAQAMPWEKYSWRPAPGVRSVCEVYLHIAGDNYVLSQPLGVKTPAAVDLKKIETCPDSKDDVIATMKASFTHIRSAVDATSDGDAEATIELFGRKMTKRALLLATAEHAGEHLGQSIAYARVNGIVPPWSAKGGM